MNWNWEQKRTFTFPDKATAENFRGKLGQGGKARIKTARLRKTPVTRVCGRSTYRAKGFDLAYNVEVDPWSFADEGCIAKLAAECGSIPGPFAGW